MKPCILISFAPFYRFELELVSEQPDLDLHSLLHKSAFLAFTPDGKGIHGQIFARAQGETGKRLNRYRLSIVPQIIAQVLQEHGIQGNAFRFQLGPVAYPERD